MRQIPLEIEACTDCDAADSKPCYVRHDSRFKTLRHETSETVRGPSGDGGKEENQYCNDGVSGLFQCYIRERSGFPRVKADECNCASTRIMRMYFVFLLSMGRSRRLLC